MHIAAHCVAGYLKGTTDTFYPHSRRIATENVFNFTNHFCFLLNRRPGRYAKIPKKGRRNEEFRKIVVDNYVILYTIDEKRKTIYISHMYYGRRNY